MKMLKHQIKGWAVKVDGIKFLEKIYGEFDDAAVHALSENLKRPKLEYRVVPVVISVNEIKKS